MRRFAGMAIVGGLMVASLAAPAHAGPCERWVHIHIPGYVDRCAGPIGDDIIGPINSVLEALIAPIEGS